MEMSDSYTKTTIKDEQICARRRPIHSGDKVKPRMWKKDHVHDCENLHIKDKRNRSCALKFHQYVRINFEKCFYISLSKCGQTRRPCRRKRIVFHYIFHWVSVTLSSSSRCRRRRRSHRHKCWTLASCGSFSSCAFGFSSFSTRPILC